MKFGLLNTRYTKAVLIISLVVFLVAAVALMIKDSRGGYNGLDLAIYGQVMWQTAQGNLFDFTIHPHSYLGDHLELILVLLTPFYWLWSQPITLVLLQTVLLLAAVWPLWLICRQWLSERWSFIIALAWLFSPFIHNINSFEFHALALVPFFMLWMIFFYLKKRWWSFVIFMVLSLTVREDISLIILTFGALAWLDGRSWRWRLVPFITASLWFIIALKLSPLLTGYEQYKFIAYYGWLGSTPLDMLLNLVNHPIYVLQNIITFRSLIFLVGLFIPFLFIPLIRPKYLLLLLLPLGQLIFIRNPGELSLQIHYTASLIGPLFVATAYSLRHIQTKARSRLLSFLAGEPGLLQSVFLTAMIGALFFMGPVIGTIKQVQATNKSEQVQLHKDLLSEIPHEASVATGYYFLTELASRAELYSLHYQFLGKQQFSDIDYRIPANTELALVNSDDAFIYHVAYEETDQANLTGDDRLRDFLDPGQRGIITFIDKYILYQRSVKNDFRLFETGEATSTIFGSAQTFDNGLAFLGWSDEAKQGKLAIENTTINATPYALLPVVFHWQTDRPQTRDYSFVFRLKQNGLVVHEERYPMAHGLYVTTSWQPGEVVSIKNRFLIPSQLAQAQNLQAEIVVELLEGRLWLDDWRGVEPVYDTVTTIGQPIILGPIQ